MNDELMEIFSDPDKYRFEKLADCVNMDNISLGMTEYQIKNFVLNKKEFPTDFFQFQQAKLELWSRIMSLHDLYYQYRKYNARSKLAKAEIRRLSIDVDEPSDIKTEQHQITAEINSAKIDLQRIEIEKYNFNIINIKKQASEKLREALVFYDVYSKNKLLETASQEELAILEEQSWKIKSMYYSELSQRYNLTPNGYVPFAHERKEVRPEL